MQKTLLAFVVCKLSSAFLSADCAMVKGGLLRNYDRIWYDEDLQRSLAVQIGALAVLLILSSFYHFVLRGDDLSGVKSTAGMQDQDIAEIDSLAVYPVKSGRGIQLDEAEVSRKGFKFDRRWAVIRKRGLKFLNLKEEPRLTLIIPSFREAVLHLRIAEESKVQLPDIGVPLEPSQQLLHSWPIVENIPMYGDFADGREAQLVEGHHWKWDSTPSEWVTKLLGYEVYFLQFDPHSSKRNAFPIFKPPHDLSVWDEKKRLELQGATNIEFQDIYPFLLASRESLQLVNQYLRKAIANDSFKIDKTFWTEEQSEIGLPMQRFRPNIILKSRGNAEPQFPGFSEDSWETVWITTQDGEMALHLVARCERCLLTTVDPSTAHRDPNVPLALLRKERKRQATDVKSGPCFGMYCIPEMTQDGRYVKIKKGDPVRVRWRPYELDDECTLGVREMKERNSKSKSD